MEYAAKGDFSKVSAYPNQDSQGEENEGEALRWAWAVVYLYHPYNGCPISSWERHNSSRFKVVKYLHDWVRAGETGGLGDVQGNEG